MLGQPKNGDARRKSALSCKLSSSRVRTQIGIRTILNSIPLPFANAMSDFLQTWTGTQSADQSVCPSRSEGNRTRQWQMAGTSDQKNAVGRLSADPAEASTCSWNRSFCARRRSTAGSTWSMCYRNRLPRRSAALRARFLRCVLSPHALEKKLASAGVSHRP